MLKENTLFGTRDKVKISIDRLKAFEPPEGYYLAFSGGKDSQCAYHLAKEAGVKFDAHYNVTGVDPPELVHFMKGNYPDVHFDLYKNSMWQLIVDRVMPPTMKARYCCQELKEHGGEGRVCVTGVRWAESSKRRSRRPFEVVTSKKSDKKLFNDNGEDRRLFENCMQKGKRIINPIIDWSDDDVWEFIKDRGIKYCSLYDEGFHRLGCIGCPMASPKRTILEFERWPKYKEAYIRAFGRMLEERKHRDLVTSKKWQTAQDVFDWWLLRKGTDKQIDGQQDIFDEGE